MDRYRTRIIIILSLLLLVQQGFSQRKLSQGKLKLPSSVTSVNGKTTSTGSVTLISDDVKEGPTNLYATPTNIRATTDPLYTTKAESATALLGKTGVMSMAQARLLNPSNAPPAIYITDAGKTGVFYLNSASSAADNGATTFKIGSLVYERDATELTPLMFGAKGDSLTDDTESVRLSLLASAGRTLKIAQVYRVNTNVLQWSSNAKIVFVGQGRLVTTATSGNILSASNQSNLVMEGGVFRAPNGNVKAVYLSYCNYVTFLNSVRGYEVGFLRAEFSNYIKIVRPTFTQVNAKSGPACIDLNFFTQIDIESPDINGYAFSLQYWGGDSAPAVNGVKTSLARNTAKGCSNLFVHNATLRNSNAGFWGSMGDNIVLDGQNLVENMNDVGLDAELSSNVTFSGFVVRGCKRGALAVFYNSDNVRFIDGRVYASAVGDTVMAIHNGNSNIDCGRVVFERVRFFSSYLQETGYLSGGSKDLIFRDCYFENVSLNVARVAGRSQIFERNTFTTTLQGFVLPLQCGNLIPDGTDPPYLLLKDNVFRNRYAVQNNQKIGRAITIYHQNEFIQDLLDNNQTYGYDIDLVSSPQSSGIAADKVARVKAANNTFGNANLFVNPSGTPVNIQVDNNNNRDGSGNFIGANATGTGLAKAVQGNSAQSRTTLNSSADDDKPSGFYNYLSSIGGISSGIGNFLGMEWRHENGSGSGGFWMKRLFSDLNSDAFYEQTKFGDGRSFNVPKRIHSDRTFPIDHGMNPTSGQSLVYNGTQWTAATAGGGGYSSDEINGFLLATDQLLDVRETGGMTSGSGYFHQVIAPRTMTVGGMAFKVTRGGSVSGSNFANAVGLFDVSGNLLAIGDAQSVLGSSGWKKVMFTSSVVIQAGTRYVLGILANGNDIPGFAAAASYGDYNQYAPASPMRNFRKSSVTTLNTTQNFGTNTSANTDTRIFLSLVAP